MHIKGKNTAERQEKTSQTTNASHPKERSQSDGITARDKRRVTCNSGKEKKFDNIDDQLIQKK